MYVDVVLNVTATTEIYTHGHTLPLHDARPICLQAQGQDRRRNGRDDRAAAAAPEDRDGPRDLRPGASRAHPAPGLRPLEGAKLIVGENGRAQVRTPVTNAHLVCRLLFAKKKPT